MKKLTALVLASVLVFSLTACGSSDADSTPETKNEEATVTEETADTSSEETAEPVAEETEEPAAEEAAEEVQLPAVKGTSHEMAFELVGCNFTENSSNEPLIRLWFTVTNESEYLQYPAYIQAWDGILATQAGESIYGYQPKEVLLEDDVADRNLLPGTTVLFAECYKMVNDTDPVQFTVTADEETFEFEIDPATFVPVVPESMVWDTVTDFSWFEPVGEEYTEYDGVVSSIADIQVVDGNTWMGHDTVPAIRIVYNVVNNGDDVSRVTDYLCPIQDGVGLELGHPVVSDEAVDILINTEVEAGESRQIAATYVLYNTTSPVLFIYQDFTGNYGRVFEF